MSHTGRSSEWERGRMLINWPGWLVMRQLAARPRQRWWNDGHVRGRPPRKRIVRIYATALIVAPIFSTISPISLSLTMSGGINSIVSPDGRIMTPASKNE